MLVIPSIASDARLHRLKMLLDSGEGLIHISGVWGACAPLVTAYQIASINKTTLYITAHPEQADRARDDIEFFMGSSCEIFPAWESLPGEGAAASEIQAERLRLCSLLAGGAKATIVAPIQALMQPVPTPAEIQQNTLTLSRGIPYVTPDSLLEWAVDREFTRLEMVENPGDVARRGEIVDLFVPGDEAPLRIHFDEDSVESIRRFDISTQRSIDTLDEASVCAIPKSLRVEAIPGNDFFAHLPRDVTIVIDEPAEAQQLGAVIHNRMANSDRLFDVSSILGQCDSRLQVHFGRFGGLAAKSDSAIDLGATSLARFEGAPGDAVDELCDLARDHTVHIFCDNDGERQRLEELLDERDESPKEKITLHIGVIHRGFVWSQTKTALVGHHEIFQRSRQRRRIRKLHAGRPLESWTDLKPGDYVVHVIHGIAAYRGLHRMEKGEGGQFEEFLTLEFAEHAIVHVPCSQIDLVQKYIGSGGRKPPLSTLGGKRWNRTKERVADSVSELAEELLRVQAARKHSVGTPYPADTDWQREFESAFLYEETEDQLQVASEIRTDLCGPRPMDRLVCGDVGYGKTELAMRAAFKVVEYGRQVAVLVPTTVLAEQHYRTFRERMIDYPFSIGCLSRFRSTAEQHEIIEDAKKGRVDIIIGTHRLLSKDVSLANLGLIVIDEEQRFGVAHKERLRAMRASVDVLTLTATPIPRTLHMSLLGIRDISSLQTPPVDRRAISTQVRPFEESLIRDAIVRELNRDGQVYFIHNFVQSIAAMADTIKQIVPDARVVYGHGQMTSRELEDVMHKFTRREADVLVATTIIESGIDIPTVNTIFINRAERFGLADMHQLRGRVGRSSHRAYCYLLLSQDRTPTPNAAKRLKTIEEFSELGAGFRIAMRDLEIRGAGNLLGKEQSGHIAAVGYELYCQLVEQTVRRLKNEPDPTPVPVQIDLDVVAHVPSHYAATERSRIEIYRRIVSCVTEPDLEQLEIDLKDTFGPIPGEITTLLQLAEIRVLARRFGVKSISLRRPDVIFTIDSVQMAEKLFVDAPGTVRLPDDQTVHLRLPPSYLEQRPLVTVLRHMFLRATRQVEAIV